MQVDTNKIISRLLNDLSNLELRAVVAEEELAVAEAEIEQLRKELESHYEVQIPTESE